MCQAGGTPLRRRQLLKESYAGGFKRQCYSSTYHFQASKRRTGKPRDPDDERLLLPASTGVGGESPGGAAAAMDLLAVAAPPHAPPPVRQLSNDCQLDAFRYGSAFSRAACIRRPDCTALHVSGTAAIDERGRSLHPGDFQRQLDATLDKIEALLAPERATLSDFLAATIFVKRPTDVPVLQAALSRRGLQDFPALCVLADICRDELLVEIDGEAVVY